MSSQPESVSFQPDESDYHLQKPVTGWWAIAYAKSDQVFQTGHSGFREDLEAEADRVTARVRKALEDIAEGREPEEARCFAWKWHCWDRLHLLRRKRLHLQLPDMPCRWISFGKPQSQKT